jgi:hypothetical protein
MVPDVCHLHALHPHLQVAHELEVAGDRAVAEQDDLSGEGGVGWGGVGWGGVGWGGVGWGGVGWGGVGWGGVVGLGWGRAGPSWGGE